MKLEVIIGAVITAFLIAGGVLFLSTKTDINAGPDVAKIKEQIGQTTTASLPTDAASTIGMKEKMYPLAPDISTPDAFINTEGKPVTLAEFKGKKVVLLDIWTYSCINCQRTLPYINAWYEKYKDQGLEVIGLHTPEFAFEKVKANVEDAVKRFGINYPVVLDNDFSTWNAYGNQYWPRKYLIDIDGFVVYDHAGEGDYEETESVIQALLAERNARLDGTAKISTDMAHPKNVVTVDSTKVGSPEIYFGSQRNEYLGNGHPGQSGEQTFNVPTYISPNKLYLDGTWSITSESAQSKSVGKIVFKYNAKNVYFVASSAVGTTVKILIDGKPVGTSAGADVAADGTAKIGGNRLYHLVGAPEYGEHTLEIVVPAAGLEAFTFTFG